jgi:septal ring factor EnvC (AmiA/AmiB activator)
LTKAFVVLVTVLSVLLVALVVPYVAKTEDFSGQKRALESQLATAQASARTSQQEISAMQERLNEQSALHSQQITNLTAERARLQTERDDAKAQAMQEARKLQQFEAELSRLSAAAVQDADLLTITTADLKETRQALVDAQTKLVQLGDRNNELESQRDSLTRQVRRIGEKMVSLEQGNVELRAVLARVPAQYRQQISTGDGAVPAQEAATPIAGTITDVQSAAGTQLVQVNIGSRDGVEANMKFLVHRDSQYVGTFVVDRVEAAQSAGRMTLTKGEVRSGDQVYTGPY